MTLENCGPEIDFVTEMRIWSILLIKSDLNGVYILVELSSYIWIITMYVYTDLQDITLEHDLKLEVQYISNANEAKIFWRDQSPPNYTWRTLTSSYVFNVCIISAHKSQRHYRHVTMQMGS